MTESFVHSTLSQSVQTISIDRQDKLNALNQAVISGLDHAFRQAQEDPQVRCIILTGAGTRAFVAGADIAEIKTLDHASASAFLAKGNALMTLIQNLGKPVIAAINGFALGGGCELALACSLRIASRSAQLGLPEIGLGLIPGYGATQRLTRLIGHGRALEMMLSGGMVSADQALDWGLVNQVTEADELETAVNRLASKLARSAPLALRAILTAVNDGADLALARGLALEQELFASICSTGDMQEGTSAFLEKRRPEFKGK